MQDRRTRSRKQHAASSKEKSPTDRSEERHFHSTKHPPPLLLTHLNHGSPTRPATGLDVLHRREGECAIQRAALRRRRLVARDEVEEHGRRGRHRDRFGNHELLRCHHGEWFIRQSVRSRDWVGRRAAARRGSEKKTRSRGTMSEHFSTRIQPQSSSPTPKKK